MQAAEVRLDGVSKRYATQWAVYRVSLHIERGEFFTFLGPSGCGKTTLLRMIAGFMSPDEGIVYLDGEPVNSVPPWKRNVGMVFQSYALWPHMNVFDNVAFGLRERKLNRREIQRKVADALRQVDLEGTEERRPSQLSGGQQQRVALARTLVIQPRVLLLDEPLSNLDAKLRVEMRLELLKLQRDLGLTTIYVTHDQEEALAMSTRIAVMKNGKIVQQGNPREVYERPADEFVATFVGQANFFSGRVAHCAGHIIDVAADDGLMIRVALSSLSILPKLGEVVFLTIRPEAVAIHEIGALSHNLNHFDGRIAASAYRGSFVEYEILAGGRTIKANVVNPKGKVVFQHGERVSVGFAPEDITLVPGNSGADLEMRRETADRQVN
jgi:iron(III) transport system ATP-binding protein